MIRRKAGEHMVSVELLKRYKHEQVLCSQLYHKQDKSFVWADELTMKMSDLFHPVSLENPSLTKRLTGNFSSEAFKSSKSVIESEWLV